MIKIAKKLIKANHLTKVKAENYYTFFYKIKIYEKMRLKWSKS